MCKHTKIEWKKIIDKELKEHDKKTLISRIMNCIQGIQGCGHTHKGLDCMYAAAAGRAFSVSMNDP